MDVFSGLHGHVLAAVQQLKHDGVVPKEASVGGISLGAPRDTGHGDLATNAAMVLAKPAKLPPRALAERIVPLLASDPFIEKVDIAGPGFINLTLKRSFWPSVCRMVLEQGDAFGRSALGKGEAVNVEYVSANPTGPMHVGHCRGAVFGDALANLLDFAGFDVTREYYVNDAGAQVDVLARSAYLRYCQALGEDIGAIPEGLYPGDYLIPVGEALAAEHGPILIGMPEEEWLPLVRESATNAMMDIIRADLALLNIEHAVFFSERTLTEGQPNAVEKAIETLREKGLVYEGRLPPPKGQLPDDWEDREQLLFRSTEYGDDVDRALVKSDGSPTYFASDIAYHLDKYRRGFSHMIDIWGADHGGYVKRMRSAVAAFSDGSADFEAKLVQIVRLFKDGAEYKMSKRSGDFITLRELVEEVGVDPVRFMMMYRKNDAQLDFDFQKVTEQSKDNPVFYVQYAHARACSVFRQAAGEMPNLDIAPQVLASAPLEKLTDSGEMGLIRELMEFPRVVVSAAEAREPHRLAFYLHEAASEFHAHWNRGKELPQLRFINQSDPESTLARLALVHATKLVLSSGLAILGVSAPEEMR